MASLTRRQVLRSAAAVPIATLAMPLVAKAAEFSFKYGNNLPLTHPLNIRSAEFAERIAQESGGKIEIKIFPNNQLGGDTDMLAQVRNGGLTWARMCGRRLPRSGCIRLRRSGITASAR